MTAIARAIRLMAIAMRSARMPGKVPARRAGSLPSSAFPIATPPKPGVNGS